MDIVKIIESRIQPRGVSDGAYLAASKDTGVDGTSEADRICELLSAYILISKVERKEYGC